MNIFTKNPNLKYFLWWGRGAGGGRGARVYDFFSSQRIQIKKKILRGDEGEGEGGGGRWMERRTGPKTLFSPSTSSKLGA